MAFTATIAVPAVAGGLAPAEAAALQPGAARYAQSLRAGNGQAIVAAMPPKVIEILAKRDGASPATTKRRLSAEVTKELRRFDIRAVSLDVTAADRRRLSDGTAIAFVPTRTNVSVPVMGLVEERSYTLALRDGARWYLMRVEDADQRRIVGQAYPAFRGVGVPKSSFRRLGAQP